MANPLLGTIQDTQGLKEVRSDVEVAFEFFEEDINVEEHSTVVSSQDVSSASIWDNSARGVWGTNTWDAAKGATTVHAVVNKDNIWREAIRDETFNDTGNTTADWDTTNFRWDFNNTEIIQTLTIFDNSTTITNARLDIASGNITSVGNLTFELSADGGSNWETVTLNTSHTFTNTGTDLRLKITASGNATIDIDDANEVSTTIKVYYNE